MDLNNETKALLLLCATIGSTAYCEPSHAQGPIAADVAAGRSFSRRDLVLAVSKVCVNEAGFDSLPDCALIWQVVEAQRGINSERLVWLERHSARVLGDRRCFPGRNCNWTRNLVWGSAEPAGWPTDLPWQPLKWRRVLEYVSRLVSGEETRRPCDETPDTWDGAAWHEENLARGYTPIECEGTRNLGYRW